MAQHRINMEQQGEELFLLFDGERIARREAGAWVAIKPGWTVGGTIEAIEMEHNGVRYH